MKRTTKKGFTLIELLAVIVILAIIALIAVPVILNIIDKANKSAFKDTAYGIISAGELYFAEQQLEPNGMSKDMTITLPDERLVLKGDVPKGSITITKEGKISIAVYNNRYCITKGLEATDVIITENIANCVIPVNVSSITLTETTMTISEGTSKTIGLTIEPSTATNKKLNYISNNESVATVDENGLVTGLAEGTATITISTTDGSNIIVSIEVIIEKPSMMTSTNNCIKSGNICTNEEILSGILVNVKVNEQDDYDFYVIKDDGNTLTLIMSENLGDNVEWYTSDDSSKGPTTSLAELALRTNDWENIPEKTFTVSGLGENKTTRRYEDKTVTGRARMITYEEVNNVNTANNGTLPSWMYVNLNGTGSDTDDSENKRYGYWTSTAFAAGYNNNAWNVTYRGFMNGISPNYNGCGLRPVIELSK